MIKTYGFVPQSLKNFVITLNYNWSRKISTQINNKIITLINHKISQMVNIITIQINNKIMALIKDSKIMAQILLNLLKYGTITFPDPGFLNKSYINIMIIHVCKIY